MVCDQRVGAEGEQFIKDEQREQIAGQRNAHGGRKGERKTDEKAGLVRLLVATHVTNGVQRVDDPQARCDERKKHAERLDPEVNLQARKQTEQNDLRALTSQNHGQQCQHNAEQQDRGHQGDGFTQVGRTTGQRDQQSTDQRHHHGRNNGLFRCQHQGRPPMREAAASDAVPIVNDVSRPKYTIATTKMAVGMLINQGVAATFCVSLRGSRKYAASTKRQT